MNLTVRPLADDELPAAWELGRLAFGGPATAPERALLHRPRREPGLTLDVRGFAQLHCGITSGRVAALAGLVSGPDDPAALDLLASGPPVQLLDYF